MAATAGLLIDFGRAERMERRGWEDAAVSFVDAFALALALAVLIRRW